MHPTPSGSPATLHRALSGTVAELTRGVGAMSSLADLSHVDASMETLCRMLGAAMALYVELDVQGTATISYRWRPQTSFLPADAWPLDQRLDLTQLADDLSIGRVPRCLLLRLGDSRRNNQQVPASFVESGVEWLLLVPANPHGRLRGATIWLAAGPIPNLNVVNTELLEALGRRLADTLLRLHPDPGTDAGEQRWRTLAEATFEAVLVHRNGRIVDVNHETCTLFGRTRDELIGRGVPGDLVSSASVATVEQHIHTHSLEKYEIDIQRADGTTVPTELRAREFVIGGVTQRVVALRNITEQKQQRDLLVEAYERLHALLNTTFEGILVHRHGQVVDANQGFANMCGYTLDEVMGMMPNAITTPESAQIIASKLQDHDHRPYVVTGLRKDGSTFPMEIQGVECVFKGERLRITGFRDLTAQLAARDRQRQLEERMQTAQRLESLGLLAGGVAHDFNNLLVSILGNAELAEQSLSDHPQAAAALQRIEIAAIKASELTRQLQAYAGRRTPEPAPLSLGALVSDTIELIRSTLPPGVALEQDLPASLPPVMGDASQVGQVVLNLLTNATEATTSSGGRIHVGIRQVQVADPGDGSLPGSPPTPGSYLSVTVRDSGSGMDEATRQRMFEPFFSTRFTGRGLGLAAVLGIVRGHGGGLRVDSSLGVGTEIEVLLPATDDPIAHAEPPADEQIRRHHSVILLVDDEPDVLLVTKAMLESAEHTVLTAPTGAEAIATWLANRDEISLVMLDLAMPDMRGEAVRRALIEHQPAVKIMFCSGFEASAEIEGMMAQGRTYFAQKPCRLKKLLRLVDDALADE